MRGFRNLKKKDVINSRLKRLVVINVSSTGTDLFPVGPETDG